MDNAFQPRVNRSFCFSIGLNRIALVPGSGGLFKRRVFDFLDGTRGLDPRGEQCCWHLVMPDPAQPTCCGPESNPPVDLDSTGGSIVKENLFQVPAESKSRTYHGRVGAARRMAGPERTSTVRIAKKTFVPRTHQGNEDTCPERLFGSTKSLIRT